MHCCSNFQTYPSSFGIYIYIYIYISPNLYIHKLSFASPGMKLGSFNVFGSKSSMFTGLTVHALWFYLQVRRLLPSSGRQLWRFSGIIMGRGEAFLELWEPLKRGEMDSQPGSILSDLHFRLLSYSFKAELHLGSACSHRMRSNLIALQMQSCVILPGKKKRMLASYFSFPARHP